MKPTVDGERIRAAVRQGRLQWHQHALERCLERGISREEIVDVLVKGEIIEVYGQDKPYPSCLMLYVAREVLHVIAALDDDAGICHVITAYRPDLEHFEPGFRKRRK
ncbi:MAG: hypothetical protein DRI34_03010 [Deltaproteobacteria bacterium]|nr:MAG: hypothetical protein DRI34_03010 [Deltaproteobacteria bacterium]